MTTLTILSSATSIADSAFMWNPLTNVTLPFANLTAADDAWGADWRGGIPDNVTWIFAP